MIAPAEFDKPACLFYPAMMLTAESIRPFYKMPRDAMNPL